MRSRRRSRLGRCDPLQAPPIMAADTGLDVTRELAEWPSLDRSSRFLRAPVQHVAETAVEPRFTSGVIVLWIDCFVVDVRKVAAEPCDLLHEPALRVDHQFPIALVPQLVTMRDRSCDAAAVRFNGVFRYEFRREWRQFPMPVNNFRPVVFDCGVHIDTSASSNRTPRFSLQARSPVRSTTRARRFAPTHGG